MGAKDDTTSPTVRPSVGDGAVKDGALLVSLVELKTVYQRQRGVDLKPFRIRQPIGRIRKCRALTATLPVVTQLTEGSRLCSQHDTDLPFHDVPLFTLLLRFVVMRYGRVSTSSSKPCSSLRWSTY